MDRHVVQGRPFVCGEDDGCAAHCQPAHHGDRAEKKIAAGVVDEEDGFAVDRLIQEPIGQRIVIVDQPGTARELFACGEEVGPAVHESGGRGLGTHVENVSGEYAFDDGTQLLLAFEHIQLPTYQRQ